MFKFINIAVVIFLILIFMDFTNILYTRAGYAINSSSYFIHGFING